MTNHTVTTSCTVTDEPREATCAYLAVVLQTARPAAGGWMISLDGRAEVVFARGEGRPPPEDAVRCAVSVPDARMSAPHARVTAADRGWLLEDLGSKNGTTVNGVAVPRRFLRDGDVIELGGTFLLFRNELPATVGPASPTADLPPAFRTLRPDLRARFDELAKVARSDRPILIRGETGTGKELTARAIHEASGRTGPFVAVNCGALPETLIEAELFGARRGAYSGATDERKGLVRAAEGGTLFLDEIAELSEPSQVALLRVLQQSEVMPVGASASVQVDVRFVAATHQNLEERIQNGRFRDDLYARLTGFVAQLPPLRERREDIGLLVASILRAAAPDRADRIRFKKSATRALLRYGWPRNIRELDHALRSALLLADADEIAPKHLPPALAALVDRAPAAPELDIRSRDELERTLIRLYRQHGGNVSAVARAMGKARAQIQRWNRSLGIDPADYRDD